MILEVPVSTDLSTTEAPSLRLLLERIGELEATVATLRDHSALFHQLGFEHLVLENKSPSLAFENETFRILDANDRALQLYRLTLSELCQLTLVQLSPSLNNLAEIELCSELRKEVNVIGPLAQRTSAGRDLTVRLIVLPGQNANPNARLAIILDETGQHSAEEALRTSEERYRELFENANDVIFLHDLNGRMLAMNRAAESLFGYSRREVIGQGFENLVAPEARSQMQDSIRAHLGGSATQHYELPVLTKNGKARCLEVSTRMMYSRGQPVGVQAIGRDITERKLAQQRMEETTLALQRKNEELTRALRLAQEATQLKEQFLANTSHELRTPMNGIMGMVELLRGTELNAEQEEYATVVSQCANDLLTIINDLLDMSQIEAGKMVLNIDEVDLQESVRCVVKLLSVRAHAKDLELTYELDQDLPAILEVDSVRFRQILTNLLGNAIKFTAAGSVRVKLGLTPDHCAVRCEVIDSGIGVEPSVQERIFEAFFQADGTNRRRYGGTGLGLAISKQLVEAMGGHIGTFNNSGAPGATFWFELPCQQSIATHPEQTGQPVRG